MRRVSLLCAASACALIASATAGGGIVNVASLGAPVPRNHQNEPAVAIDAHQPNVVVAGTNDLVDEQACPRDTATELATCWNRVKGVGISGVYFSFDRGHSWTQPTYSGWQAATCPDSTTECDGMPGPTHTLPWYFESHLVSLGDPAVAIGPAPGANGQIDRANPWANGSRVYYANLATPFDLQRDFIFPNPVFHGFTAVAVSRLDNPTPARIQQKSSWLPPVIVTTNQGQTAFEDKEQIWADNAGTSPFFGNVYACSVQFRSLGQHRPANFPAPLQIGVSTDAGSSWTVKQVTPAGTGGRGPIEFGVSGCTIRTDSHGVVYAFAEMFENPALVGLPTHGAHIMLKSFDGGNHWTKPQVLFRVTDPCFFVDPIYGRCVMDGFGGARTDLSASPSVDIANGAPTGVGATNEIVDAWADSGSTVNSNTTQLAWSTDSGTTWNGPATVSLPGDRPLYAAPAISPTGNKVYIVYEAVTSPWMGSDFLSPRPYHGIFRSAPIDATGSPGTFTTEETGGLGDIRASFPGHDLYQERVGDYVYAAATATYGIGVFTDASAAQLCGPIQTWRQASFNAGERLIPAPWPLPICPQFGNTDTWASTTG